MNSDQPAAPPRQNVELKARLPDRAKARATAERLATERLPDQHQIDTYFLCPHGRLKLREINNQRAELIWYRRPDDRDPKPCTYCLTPITDPAGLKQALSGALGVRLVVEKHREIFLHHNVRIHLDRVVGLGTFLEFEAVLGCDVDVRRGRDQVQFLRGEFGIPDDALFAGSYADMAEETLRTQGVKPMAASC